MARVASDGVLVVDTPVPLSASKQEKIVVPYLHLPAILMQLHTKHGHPTKNQMGLVFNKHFFAYRSATAIDELYDFLVKSKEELAEIPNKSYWRSLTNLIVNIQNYRIH